MNLRARLTLLERGDQAGTAITGSDGTKAILFDPPFAAAPNLQLTPVKNGSAGAAAEIVSVTMTGATIRALRGGLLGSLLSLTSGAAAAGITIHWRAKGVPAS